MVDSLASVSRISLASATRITRVITTVNLRLAVPSILLPIPSLIFVPRTRILARSARVLRYTYTLFEIISWLFACQAASSVRARS